MTTELKEKVNSSIDIISLEDLYLPFKKKRKTKADTAHLQGLEPLAKMIMSQRVNDLEHTASKYTSKEIETVEDALQGARFIIAEWINERTDIRNNIRRELERYSTISSKVIKKEIDSEKAQKFKDYFDWSES